MHPKEQLSWKISARLVEMVKIIKTSAVGLSILIIILLGFFVGVPNLGDFRHTSQSQIDKIRMKEVESALEFF